MLKWVKVAYRNILRNKRRSLMTILAISIGFAAISLFRGYMDYTYWGLRQSAIRGEGLAHLTIFKKGWREKGNINPDKYMFSAEEIRICMEVLNSNKHVLLSTPQLDISGIVTNGRISTIFIAQGVIPEDVKVIEGSWRAFRPIKGNRLDKKRLSGVEMAKGLAKILDMEPGDYSVIMSPTLQGHMNALDIEVAGLYDTGTEATNDKYMRIPLTIARSLYDTGKADRIVVLLDDCEKTDTLKKIIQKKLYEAGLATEIRSWDELSNFYSEVKELFDLIFLFLFIIVLTIVIMSVVNTMGMAVIERTREIGTLRALGMKRKAVGNLFAIEGGLIGLFGCVFGIALNLLVWIVIRYIQPTYVPPGNSSPVPLMVNLVPQAMGIYAFVLIMLSLFAAVFPARRAAGQNVVNALGHV